MSKLYVSLRTLAISSYSLIAGSCFGSAGMFDQFVIVNTGSSVYYDIGATTGNPDFQGSSLGTFDPSLGGTLTLGGQGKSYKNGGSDVTGMQLFYRIWQGAPSGTFAQLNYNFQIDNVNGTPGDQQWGTDVAGANGTAFFTPNVLTGLTYGSYTLEVYSQITTNGAGGAVNPTLNDRGGSNFTATFNVVPEPSRALLAIVGLGMVVVHRRRRA